jgi:hypothetical protein
MKAIWHNRYSRKGIICLLLGLALSLVPGAYPPLWPLVVLADLVLGCTVSLMLVLLAATQVSKRAKQRS